MHKDFKKSFLINLGVSLGVVFIILIASYFVVADVDSRVERIQNLKQDVAFRAQAIDSLVVLKDESRRAAVHYNTLFNILPTSDSLINFRRALVDLADGHKVNLGFSFGNDSPATGDRLGFAEFEATASGEKEDFVPFLKTVEGSLYFIQFDSVNLNSTGEGFNSALRGRVFSR